MKVVKISFAQEIKFKNKCIKLRKTNKKFQKKKEQENAIKF